MQEPKIEVGIMSSKEIKFSLHNNFYLNSSKTYIGNYTVYLVNDKIKFNNHLFDHLVFTAKDQEDSSFELKEAIIGVDFHWQRKEDQKFRGGLKIIVEKNNITAINIVSIEDYLTSVISSEMNATSFEELLKAHAVISRSWILAQINKNNLIEKNNKIDTIYIKDNNEYIRWWDREDHNNYDVCADDHCQRYQGITKESTLIVKEAVRKTKGEVLMYENAICDTRFSKCCGGYMEQFENVWEPLPHSYLKGKVDAYDNPVLNNIDLRSEEEASKWVKSEPNTFCNTKDSNILKQVLNDYDLETNDFFRWKKEYTQDILSKIIKQRTNIDFGHIVALIPIERGTSGRIIKLKIIGTKQIKTIGKELAIRRALSESHLYSSAFIVEEGEENQDGLPSTFTLHGAGWGHGVGLCQIGAAMMSSKGFDYKAILAHYYSGATIKTIY